MKISPLISLAFIMLALSGCAGNPVGVAAAAIGIMETRPDELPPANTADQIGPHESWCYETLGYPECFTHAQNVNPNRLINVDPANRYPLTPQAYRDVVLEYHE